MTISKEKAGALFFLVLAIAYGMAARNIRLPFGFEEELLTARTMPLILAWATGIVSALILILPNKNSSGDFIAAFRGLNWPRAILLIALMALYGLVLDQLGFLLSTAFFLFAAIYALGERRLLLITGISLAASGGTWFLMNEVFDSGLAKGELLYKLGIY
ncbi:tripartite tricarboxylate transporter TctB family protein [Aestuariispira insulae]|uniref:Putative tricarboxylic transport membrane protein n=1 Tax=Aestuariispira insulae TaxID=1461337 RepID=A0A3D9HRL1_9PROT|nr:tripartite tricarboxylate transporter TctB family protein [Aestuariispira insulae]RED52110.1 putative tricarboxylic transport membrane protein [Aestuariispira insulae]